MGHRFETGCRHTFCASMNLLPKAIFNDSAERKTFISDVRQYYTKKNKRLNPNSVRCFSRRPLSFL